MGSTRKTPTLELRVHRYLQRRGVPGGARVLVAFSGGPDSRALLALLWQLSDSYPLELVAAHLDHGLRAAEERRDETEFVRRCCAGLGVALVQESLPPGTLAVRARAEHRSLEEAARAERYRFLRHSLRTTGSSYLAVGHNLDDHVETVVMRFFQGAGVAGLRGIRQTRGRLLRPLRQVSRGEIVDWLEQRGLEYRLDSTNQDPSFLRNAVRHRLLPVVAEIFPGHPGSLERLSRTMQDMQSLLRAEAGERLRWQSEARGWSIGWEEFVAAPYLVRLQSLHEKIDRWGTAFRRIPHRFFAALREPESLQGRRVLLQGRGLVLFRRDGRLFLERRIVGGSKKGYFIRVRSGRAVVIPQLGPGLVAGGDPGGSRPAGGPRGADNRSGEAARGAAGLLPESLVIRSAQTGDRIQTRDGYKTVRKLFGEWKIPYSERWKVPIVDSRGGILAVLGRPLGYADRFRCGLSEGLRSSLERAVEVRYDSPPSSGGVAIPVEAK